MHPAHWLISTQLDARREAHALVDRALGVELAGVLRAPNSEDWKGRILPELVEEAVDGRLASTKNLCGNQNSGVPRVYLPQHCVCSMA